uniref:C2H2-type domain-containing protein n=1 Tax=Globodera pallida TaxID=36090 RepID=A0A183CAT8_GLOPA
MDNPSRDIRPTEEQLLKALPFCDGEPSSSKTAPICGICGKTFKNRGSMRFHMQRAHKTEFVDGENGTLDSILGFRRDGNCTIGGGRKGEAMRFHCPLEGCRRRDDAQQHFASAKLLVQHFQKKDLNRHEFGLDDEGSRHCLVLRFTANLINLNLKKQLAVENVDFTSTRVKLIGFCSARNELKKHSQIQASWRVGKQRKALKFAFREKQTKRSTTHAEELRWLLDKVEFMEKFKGRSVRFSSGQNVSATVNAPLNQKFVCRDSINVTLQHPRYKDIVVQLVSVANQIELQPIAASSGLGNNVFVCERTRRRTLRESFRSKMTVFSGILLGIGSVGMIIGYSFWKQMPAQNDEPAGDRRREYENLQ